MATPVCGTVDPPKQPNETLTITVDFVNRLGSATISTATVTSRNQATGASTTATIVSGSATISTSKVLQKVHAGTSGDTHILTFSVTLSDGQIKENEVVLPIFEF